MRRVLCLLAATGLLLCCCGCQNSGRNQNYTIPAAFSADINVTHGALTFDAVFSIDANGTAVTQIQSPAAVEGLEITQAAENCSFGFLGFSLDAPETLLPDTAFAKLLYAVLETLRDNTRYVVSAQGDEVVYSGMTADGEAFTLTQSKADGTLRALTMDGQKLTVTFSNFQTSA